MRMPQIFAESGIKVKILPAIYSPIEDSASFGIATARKS